MKVVPEERIIELSRTNLMVLLAKLDGDPKNSACTIGGQEGWFVRAVEDQTHYSERVRGAMHQDTEFALVRAGDASGLRA